MFTECPHCHKQYNKIDTASAGRKARCSRCGEVFTVVLVSGVPGTDPPPENSKQSTDQKVFSPTEDLDRCSDRTEKPPESEVAAEHPHASGNDSKPNALQRATPGGEKQASKVQIVVPYAVSNIVFILSLFTWPALIVSFVGTIVGVHETFVSHHISGMGSVVAFLTFLWLWLQVFRPAVRGRRKAIMILYVLYVPLVAAYLAGGVFSIALVSGGRFRLASSGPQLIILVFIFLFMSLVYAVNLYEKGLWEFACLDGACPSCSKWKFGRIRKPCTCTCPSCGTILEFVRPT